MSATCAAHLILRYWNTLTIFNKNRNHKCQHCEVVSSSYPLGQNILFSTLFPKSVTILFSHRIRGHVSHPYKLTVKNHTSVCFNLWTGDGRQQILNWMVAVTPQIQPALNSFFKFPTFHPVCYCLLVITFTVEFLLTEYEAWNATQNYLPTSSVYLDVLCSCCLHWNPD
jgi:hypothetical protein